MLAPYPTAPPPGDRPPCSPHLVPQPTTIEGLLAHAAGPRSHDIQLRSSARRRQLGSTSPHCAARKRAASCGLRNDPARNPDEAGRDSARRNPGTASPEYMPCRCRSCHRRCAGQPTASANRPQPLLPPTGRISELERRTKIPTVLPSVHAAAMLFRSSLAPRQIDMRKGRRSANARHQARRPAD
jgi:hypothetical protein